MIAHNLLSAPLGISKYLLYTEEKEGYSIKYSAYVLGFDEAFKLFKWFTIFCKPLFGEIIPILIGDGLIDLFSKE